MATLHGVELEITSPAKKIESSTHYFSLLNEYPQTTQDMLNWIELIQTYMEEFLPTRDALYEQYLTHPSNTSLKQVRQLFARCEIVLKDLQQHIPYVTWLTFCQNMLTALWNKGYYHPESWLNDASDILKDSKVVPLTLDAHSQADTLRKKNELCRDYHETFIRTLTVGLRAKQEIASGEIRAADTKTEAGVKITADIFTALGILIPVLGGIVSTLAQVGSKAYGVTQFKHKRELAAAVEKWTLKISDDEALATQLADRLLLLRSSQLSLATIGTSPAWTDRLAEKTKDHLSNLYRHILENTVLNYAQKLALMDAAAIIALMAEHEPDKHTESTHMLHGSPLWLTINTEKLIDLFQARHIPHSEIQPSRKLSIPSDPMPFSGALCYQHARISDQKIDFTSAQIAMDQQILQKERERSLKDLEKKLDAYLQSENLREISTILSLQAELFMCFSLPLGWTELEKSALLKRLSHLWKTQGFKALISAIESLSSKVWNTWASQHTDFMQQLTQLNKYDKTLAQEIRDCYASALEKWSSLNDQTIRSAQNAEKKVVQTIAQETERYHQWRKFLTDKLIQLKLTDPHLSPAGDLPENCANAKLLLDIFQKSWDNNNLSLLQAEIQRFEHAWRMNSTEPTRETVAQTQFHALGFSLQAVLTQLTSQADGQLQKLTQKQSHFQKKQQTAKKTLSLLNEAQSALRTLFQPSFVSSLFGVTDMSTSIEEKKRATAPIKEKKVEYQPTLPEKKKEISTTTMTHTFWEGLEKAIADIEQQLGKPPCDYAVITWPEESPGQMKGPWDWGLLLVSPPAAEDLSAQRYWHVWSQLFQGRLHILQNLLPIGTDFVTETAFSSPQTPPVKMIQTDHVTPYRHAARLANKSSHSLLKTPAEKLMSDYQQKVADTLASPFNEKTTQGRHLALTHLKQIFDKRPLNLDATAPSVDIHEMLLQPLLKWCCEMATYYGLPPRDPNIILDTLAKGKTIQADFLNDVKQALAWAQKTCAAIEHHWLTEKAPLKLKPGEIRTAPDPKNHPSTKPKSAAFYLDAQTQQHLFSHYRNTVGLISQTYHIWPETLIATTLIDPLGSWCQDILTQLTSGTVSSDQTSKYLKRLARAMRHRPALQQASWHLRLFEGLPQKIQLAYIQALRETFPVEEQQKSTGLIQRLLQTPTPSGRRLYAAEEQRQWEENILPMLWTTPSSPKTEVVETKASDLKSTTSDKTFSISISRHVQNNGVWQWQAQTFPLAPAIVEQLFLSSGEWRLKDKTVLGIHKVFPIKISDQITVWVKVFPEQPAAEFLVGRLDRGLGVNGTPYSELVKFHHGEYTSAALISKAVIGISLREVIEKQPGLLGKISFTSFAKTLLRVLLTNPEDDKDDDYFLVKRPNEDLYDLIRIDNERAFYAPESKVETRFTLRAKPNLQVKSIIYLLEQIRWNWHQQPEARAVLEDFLRIQPIALVSELLIDAIQQHNAWQALFTSTEVCTHFERPAPDKGLIVFFMPPNLIHELVNRLSALHTAIRMSKKYNEHLLTGLQLLSLTQPKLAQYYRPTHVAPITGEVKKNSPPGELKETSPTDKKESKYTKEHKEERDEKKSSLPKEQKLETLDAIPEDTNHSAVKPRFKQALSPWYAVSADGHFQSRIPTSQAIKTSLRTELPVTKEVLIKIYQGEASSPIQESKKFETWQRTHLDKLAYEFLLPKSGVISEMEALYKDKKFTRADEQRIWENHQVKLIEKFKQLPLRHRRAIWRGWLKPALANKQLDIEHQRCILRALANTHWQVLNLSIFDPDLITDDILKKILKASFTDTLEAPIIDLDISGCTKLTRDALSIIKKYCPHLKHLRCNSMTWKKIELSDFDELESFECQQAKQLEYAVFTNVPHLRQIDLSQSSLLSIRGEAPNLESLSLENCERFKSMGEKIKHYAVTTPFSASKLQHLNLSSCSKLEHISIPHILFFDQFVHNINNWPVIEDIDLWIDEELRSTREKFSHWFGNESRIGIPDCIIKKFKTNDTHLILGNKWELEYLLYDNFFKSINISASHLINTSGLINTPYVEIFTETLKKNTTLTSAALQECDFEDQHAIQRLANQLKVNTTLTNLNFSRNLLSRDCMLILIDALKTNIFINFIPPQRIFGDASEREIDIFNKFIEHNQIYTDLQLPRNFDHNPLSEIQAQALMEALEIDLTSNAINLNYKRLRDFDIHALAVALKSKSNLVELYLAGNSFTHKGISKIIEIIDINPSIKILDLSANELDFEIIKILAKILKTNRVLTHLYLDWNELTDVSAQTLMKALEKNFTLNILSLGYNYQVNRKTNVQIEIYLKRNREIQASKFPKPPTLPAEEQKRLPVSTVPTEVPALTHKSSEASPKIPLPSASDQKTVSKERKAEPSSQPIPVTDFFAARVTTPVPEKTNRALLKEVLDMLDQAWPEKETSSREIRSMYLEQLKPYVTSINSLNQSQRDALFQFLEIFQNFAKARETEVSESLRRK